MLSKSLDWKAAREAYAENGWVQVDGIMESDFAERVEQTIRNDVKWNLFYTGNAEEPVLLEYEQAMAMPPEARAALAGELLQRACNRYAFYYYQSDLLKTTHPVLKSFYDVVSSEQYFGFIRYVTGEMTVNHASAAATCYQPSCFLKQHDDYDPQGRRKVAHVFGFTRNWQPHWGGLLHIADDDRRVTNVVTPGFNTLVLFKVPTYHFVSQVASYAPENRYSITGWFLE